MTKFRKRPIVIEAEVFDGTRESAERIIEWATGQIASEIQQPVVGVDSDAWSRWLYIITPEGPMRADPGDWIIKGVAGEFYPCKPKIFAATYEPEENTE